MPKVFTSETQKTGEIGENIACRFLVKQGFRILDRNYTKKWGEIDIVAEKGNRLYFVEVKSVSRPTVSPADAKALADRHETIDGGQAHLPTTEGYRPEENMHPWKMKRLSRTIQTYLLSKRIPDEMEWQMDLLIVYLDLNLKKARIKVVKDIIL